MSGIKRWYAENTNPEQLTGQPADVIEGMDLFIGLSGPGIIPAEALGKMNDDAIVFAMANPNPEVMPEDAAPYVRIMATGRSDYPNQINNVLCFPGIFRGALDAGAPRITEEMKLAAAQGIAEAVTEEDLSEDYIIPSVFNRDVAPAVAAAVVEEAKRDGIARFNEETGTFSTVEVDYRAVRVLVTGASGFIGSALCDALLARGDEVVGLTRDPERGPRTNPPVAWHAWEPTLERPPAEAFEGVDGVVNLLGEKIDQRWTDESKRRIMESRRTGTHNLVEAIAARPQAAGAGQPVGGRLLRRPRRRDRRRVGGAGEASTPRSCASGRRPPHEAEASGVRLAIVRTGLVLDPGGGLLKELLPRSSSASAARSPAAASTCPGSTSTTRSGSCSGRWTTRRSAAPSTRPRPTRSPTAEFSKALGRALGRPAVLPSRLRARPEIRPRVR